MGLSNESGLDIEIGKNQNGNQYTAKEIHHKEDSEEENEELPPEIEKEIQCGYLGWYPDWLQVLASKKTYVLICGMIGMSHFAISAYFTGIITTIEKRFKIPSQTTGFLNSALDIGYTTVIICSYLGGSSHKTRWVSYCGILVTLSCFIKVLPHVIYGPGQDAIFLAHGTNRKVYNETTESGGYNNTMSALTNSEEQATDVSSYCGYQQEEDCSESVTSVAPVAILVVSQLILGVGVSSYWSLGIAYMDDNARKDKIAILVSATAFIRMLGPTIGFFLASYSLEMYIDPSLKPQIDINDPRWVGAWWYAWIPLGIFNLVLSAMMAFFPKTLPRAAMRRRRQLMKLELKNSTQESNHLIWNEFNTTIGLKQGQERTASKTKKSITDFVRTVKRLFNNKLLLLNSASNLFYMFGMVGYWTFLPKYMESQFQQSASRANIYSGSVGLICTGLGLLVSGAVITICKPSARFLAGWNMFVESLDAIGHYLFVYIGCPINNFHGSENGDNSWNLTAACNSNCNCTASVKYDPVCDIITNTTFYSPCHAGCETWKSFDGNSTTTYENCSCAGYGTSGTVIPGSCPVDCSEQFLIFVMLMSFMRFTSSTGRAGNSMMQFRCVSPDDKAFAIGLLELLLILISFIPGPIIYGILLDNTCWVWGETCGKRGNCWVYDNERLRYNLNRTATVFLVGAAILDLGVYYYAKDLKLYDEEDNKKHKKRPIEANNCQCKQSPEIDPLPITDLSTDENKFNYGSSDEDENEAEEYMILRACQSPVTFKKSHIKTEEES